MIFAIFIVLVGAAALLTAILIGGDGSPGGVGVGIGSGVAILFAGGLVGMFLWLSISAAGSITGETVTHQGLDSYPGAGKGTYASVTYDPAKETYSQHVEVVTGYTNGIPKTLDLLGTNVKIVNTTGKPRLDTVMILTHHPLLVWWENTEADSVPQYVLYVPKGGVSFSGVYHGGN